MSAVSSNAAHVDVLIELGVEEIPAGVAPKMAAALAAALESTLDEAGLGRGATTVLGTPRRLTVHLAAVQSAQPDRELEILGPPARVAFDADGNPTRAAEGFVKGQGAGLDALYKTTTDKGDYAALRRFERGRPLATLLGEALPGLIRAIPSPKRMRWGRERDAFIRPLQWIVALAGDTIIDCRFADVQSGRNSRGHRFYGERTDTGPDAFEGAVVPILRADLALYQHLLRAAYVMVDPAERRASILAGARQKAAEAGGALVDDPETLEVVTWLVEWPTSLLGSIAPALLRVPDAVTQTTLRENQKLFTVRGADGRLLPRFIATANTLHPGSEATIATGNAYVVSARMADAAFFYDSDRSKPLADFVPKLAGRTFLEGLGSTLEKVARIEALSGHLVRELAPSATAETLRAAALCKADLVTQMVFEFPELQGIIGEDYALAAGELPAVAQAIREHYLPRGASDDLPVGDAGAIVGLADRLDTIVCAFGLGMTPSGSNDPYALRRSALGVLRVLAGRGWTAPLRTLVQRAADQLPADALKVDKATLVAGVLDFFRGRLRSWLADGDAAFHAVDTAEAVLDAGFDDVPSVFERASALTTFRQGAEFAALAAGFKRIGNLARKADAADLAAAIDPALFESDAERAMAEAVAGLEAAVAHAIDDRRFADALQKLASLRPQVDAFFDGVLVMADDAAVRRNRLALLGRAASLFARLADFARIQQA